MTTRKKLPQNKGKGMSIICLQKNCKKQFSFTKKIVDGKVILPNCGLTKKKLSSCKHFDRHRYRVTIHIPGTKGDETKKTLISSTYEDALIESIEFRTQFLENLTGQQTINHEKVYLNYLFSAQIEYLNYLRNIDVPDHEKRNRTDKHIKEVKKCLVLFNKALTKNKVNKKTITLEKVTPELVGYFHTYLLNDMGYANSTYNKKMGALSTFFKWAIDQYAINQKNPFAKVQNRSEYVDKETITEEEFKSLLKIIKPENGKIVSLSKKRKYNRNLYRPFLKDALRLALHTGGRREEIVELRWNMIKNIKNKPAYIYINNFKVERMKGEAKKDDVAPKIFPITKSLLKVLHDLGYEEKRNSNEYLLSPDRTGLTTNTMMDLISKGFNHYFKQLDTDRKLIFKCLRKTYLTYLEIAMHGDAKLLSSHSTDDILKKHYIDEKIVSSAIKNLNIFDEK